MQGQLSGAAPAHSCHCSAAQGIITSHGFGCVHIRPGMCPEWALSAVYLHEQEEMGNLSISVHIRSCVSAINWAQLVTLEHAPGLKPVQMDTKHRHV